MEDFHLRVSAPCRAHEKSQPAFTGWLLTLLMPLLFVGWEFFELFE